jgi:hypothetical protein
MRGRYLMREYWSDSDLFLRLDAAQREVYVGLWMLADDDGWLPRDVPAIAAALYRYEDRAPRESRLRRVLERLRDLGKVESHRCGCIFLPAVARYPRAGKKSAEHHAQHTAHVRTGSKDANVIRTDLNPSPDVVRPDASLPDVARAREAARPSRGARTDFDERMAAAGVSEKVRQAG